MTHSCDPVYGQREPRQSGRDGGDFQPDAVVATRRGDPELVPVLFGLWRFHIARSQLQIARELGDTLLRLAHQAHDPVYAVVAHHALGVTWFYLGVLPEARIHVEAGIARDPADQRRAPVFRIG